MLSVIFTVNTSTCGISELPVLHNVSAKRVKKKDEALEPLYSLVVVERLQGRLFVRFCQASLRRHGWLVNRNLKGFFLHG